MKFFLYLLVLLSINQSINGQSYVPQVSRLIDCPINQRLVSFGNNDVSALSNQLPTSSIPSNTVITRYFNTSTPIIITQLSLGIFDNYQITNVAQIRFGIMMLTSQSTSQSINRVAQSEEILLYATARTIIYANLEQPTQLLPGINYAIVFWSNQPIYTATNQPINTNPNAASVTYSPNGLPYSSIMYSVQGDRALQATGCVSENDPFTAPGTQLYSFCAYGQSISGASPLTSSSYARSTTSQSISGVIGVSSTDGGQSSAGTWNRVIAGIGTYQSINSGPYYYPSGSAPTGKVLSLGTGSITSINQRFYPTGQQRVDDGGISFVSGDGSQYVISFINQSITLTEMSRGSYSVISGAEFAGMTSQSTNSLTNIPACLPPSKYVPDTFNCPINQSPISYGDDSLADSLAQYSSTSNYMYGNFIFFNHQFTVRTPNTVLKQLTFRIFDNPNKVAKIRMAIYQSNASASSLPTYSIVEQTREVTLINPSAGLIAINLLRDLALIEGQNYTIAVMADQFIYCSYGYQLPGPYSSTFPYEVIAANSMPSTASSVSTIYTLPLGANGCVANQQIRTVPICANFVYADRVDQYYGNLDVLATTARNSDRGSYYDVVGGRGFSNRTSTASTIGNWTVKSYYLPSNNRVYLTSLNAGRNLPLVDANGIQIVVSNPNNGYAVQMSSWVDPASASIEYKQQTQTYSSTIPSVMGNLLMATLSIGEVGSSLQCVAPARPRNIVSPATVARIICPNNENSIIDTFGDASVGSFERNADGTTIEANRIYTNAFVAESTGTVRQLAIGILNNADKLGENRVRLGLYDATTGALLGQCAQLVLNEAVDQLIVMNLPTAVTIEAGRRYYIAVIASSVLEVATSAQANSPSMTSTFSTTGLPATFATTGDAVSVSVGAYVCVSSTHSICAYFQYAPSIGSSTTLMYQALAQASPTSQTNAYGTYRTVTAFAGRVTQYSRTASSPTNALSLFLFTMRSGTTANLYTASSNGYALDTQGVMLDFTNGATSQMQFNASINKMDESFRLVDKETDLIYSGIRIQELTPGGAIASCGLPSVPKSTATNVPAPSCPSGQTLVSFGDADQEDVTNNQEGLYSAPASQIFLRQITTGTGSGFLMHQVKFGININYNTVNRIRMGLYDANYTFMAGTEEIIMYNPDNQMFTGTLTTPQYLAPNTIYYLAWWTEAAVYAGFSSVAGPAGMYPFSGPWPTTFENKNPNSQRAIAALGCTTSVAPPRPQPGTESTSSSSSSSNLSGGAVAGIVIGCVIGTNLLLLACLWLCCLGTVGAAKGPKHMELEESRTTNVELGEVSTQA